MKTGLAAAAVLCSLSALAVTQLRANEPPTSYPTKAVSIVVPFAAGGSSDTVMRLVGPTVSKEWGQPIIIDNRVGATGAIAGEYTVRQPADGYTLLNAAPTSHTALRALRHDLPYDPMTDLVPVVLLTTSPMILVVNPQKVPVHNVKELIEYAKAHPGKLTYASTGIGSVAHLSVEQFKLLTKTDMVHVPYRGNAPALNDLLAGNVDLTIDVASSVNPHIKSGKLRALAFTTPKRVSFDPDIPTVGETVPGFEAQSWNGIVVRTGTPANVIAKIQGTFSRAILQPEAKKVLGGMLMEPAGGTAAEFSDLINADRARWERVVKAINLNPAQK